MHWLLIVVTYLGGNTFGPVVHTQTLQTKTQCEAAASAVVARVDDMSKTNAIETGRTKAGTTAMGRQVVSTSCVEI